MEKTEQKTNGTLRVTDVRILRFKDGIDAGRIRAVAEVTLEGQLLLKGLRVTEGEGGLFVAYPHDPFYRGEDYRTLYAPVTRELRERIEDAVLGTYHEENAKGGKR